MNRIFSDIKVLSEEEIEKIHKGTLRLLENVGLKVPNSECLDICERFGAWVDRESSVVRIPKRLMEEVLAKVKKEKDENEKEGEPQKLVGRITTQVFIVDYKTKTRRYGLMRDVMDGILLAEHLDNMEKANAVVVPSDVPNRLTDVMSYKMIYTYSKRPGGTYILSNTSAKYIIEMAKVMGKTESYLLETVTPLQFRDESLEMALTFAKAGQQLRMGPMVIAGASAPVTMAGTLLLQNAEVLGSLVMIYVLTNEFGGYNAPCHSMDLRTMLCSFGSPNQALLGIATAQMGRYYGLKPGSNSGLTDSCTPDFQAGFEKGVNGVFSLLAGNVQFGSQGIVGADQGVSLEQLVIDNEWIDFYNFVKKGFVVSDETMAVDLVERIGIGGNFLADEHTVEHMRDYYWKPRIFNRHSWENWVQNGGGDILDKAHEYVNSILKGRGSMEPVISASRLEEINYIAKCAEEELVKEV